MADPITIAAAIGGAIKLAGAAAQVFNAFKGGGGGSGGAPPTPAAPEAPAGPPPVQQDFTRPGEIGPPGFLQMSSQMSPLQQRSAIATGGVLGNDSKFRDPASSGFFSNVAQRALIGESGELADYNQVLPIERQFVEQVLGTPIREQSTAGFLDALMRGTTA